MDLFSHLKFTFDLDDGKVSTETAARGVNGEPYYWHVFDLKDAAQVGVASTAVEGPATVPTQPITALTPPTTVPAPPMPVPTAPPQPIHTP